MYTDDLSDDDEAADGRNTIGRVPLHWYDEYEHIGYDLDGARIGKRPARDALDAALARVGRRHVRAHGVRRAQRPRGDALGARA